ncbi:MAG: hypothetical protein AAF206_26970 [Bacteroidota bacterium]
MWNRFLITLPILSLFVLIACEDTHIGQADFRNPDYYWFVEAGDSIGRWVKIDHSGKSAILKNGHCTAFYRNGEIRETFRLDVAGNIDTSFYYHPEHGLTHYVVRADKGVSIFVYKDGPFQIFDPEVELIFSGTVENHQIIRHQWQGAMQDFVYLLHEQSLCWRNTEALFKQFIPVCDSLRIYNRISEKTLNQLDKNRLILSRYTDSILSDLKQYPVGEQAEAVKQSTVTFIEDNQQIAAVDLVLLIQFMGDGFHDKNAAEIETVLKRMLTSSKWADKQSEQAQVAFIRSSQLGNFPLPFFEQMNEEILENGVFIQQ